VSCLADVHDHVVASGTCTACRLPVQLTGGTDAVWLAVPFRDDAATCRATGDLHVVEHAVGACCGCSAVLEAVGTGDRGLVWLET
jgi:hypothetical protein